MIGLDIRLIGASPGVFDQRKLRRAMLRAVRKAGSTGLRDMRSEARKRVRARKRLRARAVRSAMVVHRKRGSKLEDLAFALRVSDQPQRVSDYPHRQNRRGVSARINREGRSQIPGAFIATMPSGHKGVFLRRGKRSLPIDEQLASRTLDALLHEGEAEGVLRRGQRSFSSAVDRLIPIELEKLK